MNKLIALLLSFLVVTAPAIGYWEEIQDIAHPTPKEIEIRDTFLKAYREGQSVSVAREGNWVGILIEPDALDYPIDLNRWDVVWGTRLWWDYVEQRHPPVLQKLLDAGELLHDLFVVSPKDPLLLSTVQFISQDPGKAVNDHIRTLKWRLHALLVDLDVGYPAGTLGKFPDCKKFFEANPIEHLVKLYGHQFQLNAAGEPMLLYQGKLECWHAIHACVPLREDGTMSDHVYTLSGIELGTPDSEIRLIQKDGKAAYGHRSIIEVRAIHRPNENIDYWIRLHQPNGDVYSIGWEPIPPQFQMHLGTYSWNWKLPLETADHSTWLKVFHRRTGLPLCRGKVVSPAPEEQSSAAAVVVPIEVSIERMEEVLQFVKGAQKYPDAIGGQGQLGSAASRHFASLVLLEAGIVTSLDREEDWALRIHRWREEQLKVLQERGADASELDLIRFGLPQQF